MHFSWVKEEMMNECEKVEGTVISLFIKNMIMRKESLSK